MRSADDPHNLGFDAELAQSVQQRSADSLVLSGARPPLLVPSLLQQLGGRWAVLDLIRGGYAAGVPHRGQLQRVFRALVDRALLDLGLGLGQLVVAELIGADLAGDGVGLDGNVVVRLRLGDHIGDVGAGGECFWRDCIGESLIGGHACVSASRCAGHLRRRAPRFAGG